MRILSLVLLMLVSSLTAAQSSVWKVSKGGEYFYLGGTIHLLNKNDHPLPKEFMVAYNDSQKLIFEIDLNKSKTLEAQQKFMAVMVNPTGKTLSDTLTPKTYINLASYLNSKGIPPEHFASFYPWAVGLTISVMKYQQLGMQPEYGVDEYFYNLAKSDKKATGALETLEQQIQYMQSMGEIEPNMFINYTLRDLKELPKMANAMTKSWRAGDMKFFTENNMLVQSQKDFPDLYNTLLTQRNNNWMPQLFSLIKDKQTEFVLVGTMHLTDKNGLLNQLKKAGFKVEQL